MNQVREQLQRIGRASWTAVLTWLTLAAALATLLWLAPAWAEDESLVLELIDGAKLSGATYSLGDVCDYVSGNAVLWERLKVEPMGYAPAPGSSITLATSTILGRLAERGYDWRQISLRGPEQITIHGTVQSLDPSTVLALLDSETSRKLEAAVSFEPTRAMSVPKLPVGELAVTVRFPDKPGRWLPDAIEFHVDGRLATVMPLGQLGKFHLRVLVAPAGIAARTLIDAGHLGLEEQVIAPGQEVTTCTTDAVGLTTRSQIAAGAMVKLSRLKQPYDVTRLSTVTLLIRTGGVEMSAQAQAMADAYVGQVVLVKRLDDNAKFSGLVVEGPLVVVE